MRMKTGFLVLAAAGGLLILLSGMPGESKAFCVYNKSNYKQHVMGTDCKFAQFDTKIPVNGKACCPGDNRCCGKQDIVVRAKNHEGEMTEKITMAEVPAHGWMVLRSGSQAIVMDPSYLTHKIYSKDGGLIHSGLMGDYASY